jgi:biopolymer transport protein ExbB/TolQ
MTFRTASATVRIGVVILAIMSSIVFYVIMLRQYGALPTVRENHALLMQQRSQIDSLSVKVDSLVFSLKPWRIPWVAAKVR